MESYVTIQHRLLSYWGFRIRITQSHGDNIRCNYVMGGGTQSFVNYLYGNFYVFKTDPSGNVLWSTSIGNGLGDECLDLIETSDHSIVGAIKIHFADSDHDEEFYSSEEDV